MTAECLLLNCKLNIHSNCISLFLLNCNLCVALVKFDGINNVKTSTLGIIVQREKNDVFFTLKAKFYFWMNRELKQNLSVGRCIESIHCYGHFCGNIISYFVSGKMV